MATPNTQELLTLKELASLTKIKVSTWRKAIAQRRISFVRLGRSIRVPAEVVEKMIQEGWQPAIDYKTTKGEDYE